MTVLSKPTGDKEKKNYHQDFFLPDTVTAVKPKSDSRTVFRPIAEIDASGNPLPMVIRTAKDGLDFSNIKLEDTVLEAGQSLKFTGVCAASDNPLAGVMDQVFSSLYIKLKAKEKRFELPPALKEKVSHLLEERPIPNNTWNMKERILKRSSETGFMQGIALVVNGKPCERPAVKQVLTMSSNLLLNINKFLTECHAKGIDVFSAKLGYELIIEGLPKDLAAGRSFPTFTVALGKQLPLPEDRVKTLWVPWANAIRRFTTDQHIAQAIRCYGKDVVGIIYPDDVERLAPGTASAPVTVTPAAPVQQARPAQPVAVTSAGVLDLSNAISGDVESASAPATPAAPATGVAPASPDALADSYAKLLSGI